MGQNCVRRVGGVFPPEPLSRQRNGIIENIAGPGDDLRHMMSGRCGISLAIQDWQRNDARRVAYLPSYTCETVSGCFIKYGYQVLYYDMNRDLVPQYDDEVLDKISLFLMCGYYGFSTADETFAAAARQRGVGIIFDATHSAFTEGGVSLSAHYVAASLRKWFPVACGGIAVKRKGDFIVDPVEPHQEHMALRYSYLEIARRAQTEGEDMLQEATDDYWRAEMLLREIYQAQMSDAASIETVLHYPVERMAQKRVENYSVLLEAFPNSQRIQPVFRPLPPGTCPSHFPIYSENRDGLLQALKEDNIYATVYWPVPPFIDIKKYPGSQWVYDHIMALPCDQRYGPEDMRRIASSLQRLK